MELLYELEILLMVQNFRVRKDLVWSELLRGRMNLCSIGPLKGVITDFSTLPLFSTDLVVKRVFESQIQCFES